MTIMPNQVWLLKALIDAHEDLTGDKYDPDPDRDEMIREVRGLYSVIAHEVQCNGGPLDASGSMMSNDSYDVLLVPHECYDLDRLKEYAETTRKQEMIDETDLRR